MMQRIQRRVRVYGALAAMMPKLFMAYSIWVWMQLFVNLLAIIIFVYFWRAVYAGSSTIGGLNYQQTINYILLAQVLTPLAYNSNLIYHFGHLMREGLFGIELLRPIDFQANVYIQQLAELLVALILNLPLGIMAWFFFGLQLPTHPLVWLCFIITAALGNAVLFLFDYIVACISFYITEIWGLSVLRFGISTFLSGALVPLEMMPHWLQQITLALPFAQALYAPVSILSGITSTAQAPRLWLVQLLSIVALGVVSRLVFQHAARQVTVQGG